MAAFRQNLGRRSYDFAHRIHGHDLQNKERNSLLQLSSLVMKYRLRDIENYGLRIVGNVATRMTEDGCATAAPMFVSTNKGRTKRKVSKNEDYGVFTKDCRSERNFSRFGPRSQRTLFPVGSARPPQIQIRAYTGSGAPSEPLFQTKTGYYDVLEVAPSATQAQIKTAYYKQSFLFHPDRNASSETATARFSEISEAYAVLGNKTLRKKYDRGLLSLSDLVGTGGPPGKEPAGGGAKPRADSRRTVTGSDGRGKIYNFDAFFKSHYREQLQREKEFRFRRDEFLKNQTEAFEKKKMGWLVEMGIGVMVTLAAVLWIGMKAR